MSILSESLLTLHDAAKLLPSNRVGKRVNFSTIWRWALKGIRAIDGRLVRLEVARVGGRWLTSREAIERFSAELTPRMHDAPVSPRTPIARKRAADRAKRRLEQRGI